MHDAAVRNEVLLLAERGLSDGVIARETGIARTTVRGMRRGRNRTAPSMPCPRCWRPGRRMRFTDGEYAELLGLYLGDGCVSHGARSERLRLSLDPRHPEVIAEARALLEHCFAPRSIGTVEADGGATTVLSVYARHLSCLFPQHGPGKKHERAIVLEPWQQGIVSRAPWSLLRGLIRSDGCVFINRTGMYRYLSYDFCNRSEDILDLFCRTCDLVGVSYSRSNGRAVQRIRICQRPSVQLMATFVGIKR